MVWLFSATLFLSAALLFFIELMFGSMILPRFGGTPAVWNTCMLFFQAAMLAGYLYSHWAPAWLGVRRHRLLHLLVLLLPLAFVPIAVRFNPPGDGNPVFWLLAILSVSIGVPFFVVATTNPLLQTWFAHTEHRAASDPYFLYAASNAGSMIALLAYPALPALIVNSEHLGLRAQGACWAAGYGLLVLLIAACACFVGRAPDKPVGEHHEVAVEAKAPSGTRVCRWVALAFVPSSLMLGVTTHLSTDVSPGPLSWVMPLALYLLSFILVFSRVPAGVHATLARIMPMVILLQAYLLFTETTLPRTAAIGLHLLTLFLVSMVCHGELALDRPDAKHLTAFYLWMSVGGVLGGVFNALAAPVLFHTVAEYPLVLSAACFFLPRRPGEGVDRPYRWQDIVLPVGLGLFAVALGRMTLELRAVNGSSDTFASHWGRVASLLPVQGAIFALAWVLSRRAIARPIDARFVTGFVVGVLVGVSVALLAAQPDAAVPLRVMAWCLSSPTAMAFVCLLMPFAGRDTDQAGVPLDVASVVALALLVVQHVLLLTDRDGVATQAFAWLGERLAGGSDNPLLDQMEAVTRLLQIAPPILLSFAWVSRPTRFGLALVAIWLAAGLATIGDRDAILLRERSFFGTVKLKRSLVKNERGEEGAYHELIHGTTVHGLQALDADGQPRRDAEPTAYYHRTGPVGAIFAMLAEETSPRPVAVIGLGVGTTAAYARPKQEFVFYEIDATVRDLAENARYFTFLRDARDRGANLDVVLGDARLSLQNNAPGDSQARPDGHFRFIAVDAFSSDAIPVHLITREAVELYLQKLAPDGILAFHISNRYLDLEPVLAAAARQAGLRCIIRRDSAKNAQGDVEPGKLASVWAVLARADHCSAAFGSLLKDVKDPAGEASEEGRTANQSRRWYWIEDRVLWYPYAGPDVELWTDDYSNLLDIFRW
jgi:spermidine synthase